MHSPPPFQEDSTLAELWRNANIITNLHAFKLTYEAEVAATHATVWQYCFALQKASLLAPTTFPPHPF